THDFPFEYEDRMHNDIFDTSVTRGLLGLFSYLFLIFAFFIAGIRLFFKSAYEERIIVLGLVLGVLGYLVQNEFSFGLPCISSLFWMMMGSLFLITKQKKQKIKAIKRDKILLFLIPIFLLFIPLFFFYYADLAFRKNDYKWAIRLNPFCRQYRESYGTYLVDMGKNYGGIWPDKIILEMSKACRIFKNDGILLSILGMGYEMKQDINNALPIYEKALKINPYLGNTYNNLGAIYGNQGRYKEAGEVFLAGLYGFPWDSMLFGNAKKLGLIMLEKGDIGEAERVFSRLTEIYKNKDELISLHKELSLKYLNNGKRDLVIKHLEAILKISPSDIETKRRLTELKNW
ncbi:MAG: tetratricopeptide repeat protein, partial [bacterium]